MSVGQDNETVCMHAVVTVHSLGTSGLNYCLTSHSKPATAIFHTHMLIGFALYPNDFCFRVYYSSG